MMNFEKTEQGVPLLPLTEYEEIPKEVVWERGPSDKNPRNSEGAFLDLEDGRLLFAWSLFEGDSPADYAPASCYAMISEDDGKTWGDPFLFLDRADDEAENVMCINLLRMQNGDIGLFYFLRREMDDGRLWLRRTSDLGKTWSEPTACTTGKGYYVTNNDRVVRLQSGRLIVPAAYHRVISTPNHGQHWDGRSSCYFFYSDDDGETWYESNPCTLNVPWSSSGLQEPGVFEVERNVLYAWARTDMGYQYEMWSTDGGETWSEARPGPFTSPNSPLSMKRDTKGMTYAVWNPTPYYNGRAYSQFSDFWSGGRTPLVISKFNHKHAPAQAKWLECEPDAGYCYTAMHADEHGLLLAYCAGQRSLGDGNTLQRLRMVRINQEDLDALK